ncbi:MAG: fluoride efflux transporter CrcB [Cytophagales bacterium CG12_big_fil_rev_8_21_14_0_65_40_12]|nr:MAG: fluoride efflux transporter CrcB [Cytophagales bacterium CG12_big_fil_rev_8_21_14_0_65_40_12]PIW05261.1 MAG: fluoride efflux transporter CrcB [Cytophagales bacterium CG17_big_fil_post_rev_8_21_14_2_50_40_13]
MIKNALLIALGGGVGSACRYLIQTSFHNKYPNLFPYGTFAVNILGCLLIGLLMGLVHQQKLISPQISLLLIGGFCGGFTTFSTFAYEGNTLLLENKPLQALLYLGLSVVFGMLAAYLGYKLTRG